MPVPWSISHYSEFSVFIEADYSGCLGWYFIRLPVLYNIIRSLQDFCSNIFENKGSRFSGNICRTRNNGFPESLNQVAAKIFFYYPDCQAAIIRDEIFR